MNAITPFHDNPAPRTPVERVNDFVAVLRRRWTVAAVVFGLTVVAALGVTLSQQKQYDATALVLVKQPDAVAGVINPAGISSAADAERDITTDVQLITVTPVLQAVRSQLHLQTSLSALARKISVSGQDSSNLVSITAQDTSPQGAAALATAVATQYRIFRQQTALAAINSALNNALASPNATRPGSAVAGRITQLQAAAASETGGAQIIRDATVPSGPSKPRVLRTGLEAVGVGLVLALAAVFGLEAIDRRLFGEDDFEAAFGGAPVLATLPPGSRMSGPRSKATQAARRAASADLAAMLVFTSAGKDARTIMVAPAAPGDSAAGVVEELSAALEALDHQVEVVDADLRKVVLFGGRPTASPEALLGRPALRMAIDQARDRADIVLVQAPPLDRPGATMPVARLCDGIIVVGRPRSIKAARARAIMDLLSATPTPILGIVLDPASGQATRASARERGGAPSRSAEHASIADELNSPTVEEVT